jgi:excisionase family DNA binding protein
MKRISRHLLQRGEYGPNSGLLIVSEFEPLLNSQEAAKLLQIHHKTLQKLARRGDIRGSQIGKLWRFRVSDLDAWFGRNSARKLRA